jgi:D-alanyl-D-alanine carboxypeptidase
MTRQFSGNLITLAARMSVASALLACTWHAAAASLQPDTEHAIDAIVTKALAGSVTPSVSIAIVKDGKIAYAHAYGDARLSPAVAATPAMRYKIASNSKQIAAAAILLLAEEHKLSLDDRVARFFPKLTRARDISLRQLLNHTSGYQDYYAVDYLAPSMLQPTTPQGILDVYAAKPLDFEPGTRWQYSNTNYVLLGRIVEKVSGLPLMTFLQKRIFSKLGMDSAIDSDGAGLGPADPRGYTHYALGPVREVAAEGKGWMWAAGELAMTASDLAKWDISLLDGTILKPASLKAMGTAASLDNGISTGYALGLSVSALENGHRRWRHTGGASGFLSINTTYPDDRMAITVLSNGEGNAQRDIAIAIEKLLLAQDKDAGAEASLARTRQLLTALQKGVAERALMTDDLNGYFSSTALADFAASLAPLGEIVSINQTHFENRGGMAYRIFAVKMSGKKTLKVAVYIKPDGRFDQYLVSEMAAG